MLKSIIEKVECFAVVMQNDADYRKRQILRSLPYLLVGYLGNKMMFLYRIYPSDNIFQKAMASVTYLSYITTRPLPSFYYKDILGGIVLASFLYFYLQYRKHNKKHIRINEEYGSARWGRPEDIAPFINKSNPDQNIILTATESLTMENRMPNPAHNRNKNVLVVGGSGTGKTRFVVKPNLMQLSCSYVVTDPKGSVLLECGKMLQEHGYKIKVINTINFEESMHYNPFTYIRKEEDIMRVSEALIAGTTTGKQQGEQFWQDAEKLLYAALIGYIWYVGTAEERNFETLIEMVDAIEIHEEDDSYKCAVDYMFEELEKEKPYNFAVRQYKKFKQAAGKTARSIMITVGARLSRFDYESIRELTRYDDLELDLIGDELTALFIITSDTDSTFDFIATILYSQLFHLLCDRAGKMKRCELPIHVRCIMDEFANLGKLPNWEKLITVIRSRNISATMMLQNLAQLKSVYKDDAPTIRGNCDSYLYLGGNEKDTLKEISELLGKETIELYTEGSTKGSNQSYSRNKQKLGRELMTPDEIFRLPGDECILMLRGLHPFKSKKYDITSHKRYVELADYDEKNYFDLKDYFNVNLKLNTDARVWQYRI